MFHMFLMVICVSGMSLGEPAEKKTFGKTREQACGNSRPRELICAEMK